ncbi:MAG: sigma-70 family RNA polymerase sigma factor [Acidobacteriota bacterium]
MGPVAMRSIATGSLCVALRLRDARVRIGLKHPVSPTFWNFPTCRRESIMSAGGLAVHRQKMTLQTTPSDPDLLRLMMAGDEDAFTMLYRRRQGGVYRFALQMSGSQTVAEDVTQEVFMVLMREAARFDPNRGSLAAYLYGIARNHVLRRLERDRLFVQLADPQVDGAITHDALIAEGDPLGDLTRNETIKELRDSILVLPAHYREAIVLCELHEMSYVEAAGVIGCAVGTVRSRLHRARALLLERLRATRARSSASEEVKPARCFA